MLQAAAAAEIGDLTERELFLLGVVAYWCEGAKEKPWSPKGRVSFINSDAELVALFCTWLRLVGIADEDRVFRLAIHERADIEAAQRFWRGIVGGREDQWRRPTLKKHRPKTVRHNTGAEYVGCLVIEVRRSTELNRRIAGWWRGIAATSPFLRPVP
jgi:hypothetical protein